MFFKKAAKGKGVLRILYASDFHGSELVYRKYLSAALQYQADVMLTGGDITGKAMVPIIHKGNGHYEGHLFGRKEEPATASELEHFKETVGNVGFYPIVLEPEEAEALEADSTKMGLRFEDEMCNRMRHWLELYVEKVGPTGVPLYFLPGNDDIAAIDDVIKEFADENVRNPDKQHFWLSDDHELVGLANANMTPWKCNRDLEDEQLSIEVNRIASMLEKPESAVMVIHVPPYDAGIDVCPELDENLKIVARGGQVVMKPAGSRIVREMIERVQPLLTLHGHIHEAAGHTRIGRTLCINAGSEYAEGIMKAAIINLDRDRVKGHVLISS